MPETWGVTPRQSIEAECARRGRAALVAGLIRLLEGQPVDDELIVALGGPHGRVVLDGHEGGREGYWPRVWAARGLLHVWSDEATAALVGAAGDDSWRVREMVAKVVARHEVGDSLEAMVALQDDRVARVRTAARRAVESVVGKSA